MRKIILNLAMSLDGYICDEDGGFDWIKGDGNKSNDTKTQFNYQKFLESIDTIVMGKKAYLDCGIENFESKKVYVATSKKNDSKCESVKIINGDISKQIVSLKEKAEGKNIWLFGGAGLTDSFIKNNIIDEYIIGIIPTILGKGRKLFLENNPEIKLQLEESTTQEGIVILKYSIRGES
ncbi:MAG: dihydrofolate reductase [Candidatus Gracilibacteria bacterium]|nr:dihydrofolate reductase [Candidatus Gracilibacteria bacterium]